MKNKFMKAIAVATMVTVCGVSVSAETSFENRLADAFLDEAEDYARRETEGNAIAGVLIDEGRKFAEGLIDEILNGEDGQSSNQTNQQENQQENQQDSQQETKQEEESQKGYTLDEYADYGWVTEQWNDDEGAAHNRAKRIFTGTLENLSTNEKYKAWIMTVVPTKNDIGFIISSDGENYFTPETPHTVEIAAEQSSCLPLNGTAEIGTDGVLSFTDDTAKFFLTDLRMMSGALTLNIKTDLSEVYGDEWQEAEFSFSLGHYDDIFRNIYDNEIEE